MRRLERLIELAEERQVRTKHDPTFARLAAMYEQLFSHSRSVFVEQYGCDLVQAFRRFQELGVLEIIGCAATHGYLPLMQVNEKAVRAQIRVGVDEYRRLLGRNPRGLWLPECAYYLLDTILKSMALSIS